MTFTGSMVRYKYVILKRKRVRQCFKKKSIIRKGMKLQKDRFGNTRRKQAIGSAATQGLSCSDQGAL